MTTKQGIDEKRAYEIFHILKDLSSQNSVRQKDIKELIKLSDNFLDIFQNPYLSEAKKPREDGWWDSTRAILQYYTRGLKHSNINKEELFIRVSPGRWTYKGNEKFDSAINVVKEWEKDNKQLLSYIENLKDKNNSKEYLIKSRLNQGKFRDFLINELNCSPIKEINDKDLLIASHIVDYSDCDSEYDKGNPYNGLLLSPDIDKLFDNKIITFNTNGKIIITKQNLRYHDSMEKMIGKNYQSIKLPEKFLTPERIDYLERRNNKYFKITL